MIKNLFYITFFISLQFSCDHFKVVKKENRKEILETEWSKVDKTNVEEPPLFESCQSADIINQKNCFAKTLNQHINSFIKNEKIIIPTLDSDTLWVGIHVDKQARITCNLMINDSLLNSGRLQIQKILQKSMTELPPLQPATKRGVPTNVKYRLPIIINSLR